MGVTAAVAAVAGAGASAFGAVEAGKGQQAADKMQAAQLQSKAEYAGIAAEETNATMTDKLATTLGNIDVIRAAGHDDPTSPTTRALRGRAAEVGNQERAIRVGNIYAQQSQDLASSSYLNQAGTFAMNMGYVTAGADVLGAIGKTSPGTFGAPAAPPVGPPLDILNA
jgi:ABC-type multidrug transport system fused ATPase/permease subunit